MSQFAADIQASESLKYVMFAGVLYAYEYEEAFCRCAWRF